MAATYVQSKCSSVVTGGGSTTVAVTLDSTVGSGGALAIVVMWSTATDVGTSVTDDKSNSYTAGTALTSIAGEAFSAKAFYLNNITNGPITITATVPNATYRAIGVMEASGIDTGGSFLRTSAQQSQSNAGASAVSSGDTGVSAQAGDFVFGATVNIFDWFDGTTYFSARTVSDPTFTKPSGAAGASGSASTYPIAVEYGVMSGTAVTAATFSHDTGTDDAGTFALVFAAASGGGGGGNPITFNRRTMRPNAFAPGLAR